MTDGNRVPSLWCLETVTDWVQAANSSHAGEKKPAEAGFLRGVQRITWVPKHLPQEPKRQQQELMHQPQERRLQQRVPWPLGPLPVWLFCSWLCQNR
jgi:hypothetical protein